MDTAKFSMNPNKLVQFIRKFPEQFTSSDLLKFCKGKGVLAVNFRNVAEDGKLKTLIFFISSEEYLETILTHGEG